MIISLEVHRQTKRRSGETSRFQSAFTAYFLLGKWISFLCCLVVFAFFSCCRTVRPLGGVPGEVSQGAVRTHSSQPPSDSSRLLRSQIEREVLFFLVELAKVLARLLVDYSQHPSDRLSNDIATEAKHTKRLAFPHSR